MSFVQSASRRTRIGMIPETAKNPEEFSKQLLN
jgi:hypothetical protein